MGPMAPALHFTLPDALATDRLGAALARGLPGAVAQPVVLYLQGELGAGKTTCVRSLLRALGAAGLIRSPTYTLVEVYALQRATCLHLDLYRLRSALEVEELGLREHALAGNLWLVEWPELGRGLVPSADLTLTLGYAGAGREAALQSASAVGQAWLRDLADDASLTPYVSNKN